MKDNHALSFLPRAFLLLFLFLLLPVVTHAQSLRDSLWAVDSNSFLHQINPDTGAILNAPQPQLIFGDYPFYGLTFDPGSKELWGVTLASAHLYRINRNTGQVITPFTNVSPVYCPVFEDLAFGQNYFWAIDVCNYLYRINPGTGNASLIANLSASISYPPSGMAYGNGYLWVIDYNKRLYRVDPANGQTTVVTSLNFAGAVTNLAGLAFGHGLIYALVPDSTSVFNYMFIIDPSSGEVLNNGNPAYTVSISSPIVGLAYEGCDPGYYGPDCLSECPGGAANPCNGQGTCDDGLDGTGTCTCDPGYIGNACDKTPWAQTYGGSESEVAYSISQTSDGGYVVAGYTLSFGAGSADILVMKLDEDGAVSWQKTYGGSGFDGASSIQQTADGGYIVTGFTASAGAGNQDIWILKLNAAGEVTWQKRYEGTSSGQAWTIQQTIDGGYIMATHLDGTYLGVTKLDSNGNIVWQQRGGRNSDSTSCIQQTADGGFIVVATPDTNSCNILVVKFDANGSLSWQKTYLGPYSNMQVGSIRQAADGGYILAWSTRPNSGSSDVNMLMMKLDSLGTISWQKSYGGDGSDLARTIQPTSDGGYVLVGDTSSFGAGSSDILALKIDGSGNVLWQKTFGTSSGESTYSIQQTSDGGYVIAGTIPTPGTHTSDFLVLKLDAEGNIPQCPLIGSSVPTVAVGTSYDLGQTVTFTPTTSSVYDTTFSSQVASVQVTIACPECASGYYGPDCTGECPGGAANACNGHGICDDGLAGTGTCTCDPGFTDVACDGYTSTCEGACAHTRVTCEEMCYAEWGGGGSKKEYDNCMANCLASYNTCLAVTCAPDDDGDGIPNTQDNCPDTPNGPALGTCISGDNAGEPCHSCVPACERTRDTCEAMCEMDFGGPGMPGYDQCIADCETVYDNCVSACPDECGGGFCSSNQEDTNGDGSGDVCYQSIEISDEQVIDSFVDDDGQIIDVMEYEYTITDNGVPVEGAEVYIEVDVIEEDLVPPAPIVMQGQSLNLPKAQSGNQVKTTHKIVSHPSNPQGKTKVTFFKNGCSLKDDTKKYTFNHDKNKKHKWFPKPGYGCCQVMLTRCNPDREICFKSTSAFCGLKDRLLRAKHLGSTSWTDDATCNPQTGQCEGSTLIELSSLNAASLYKSVKITWSTGAEINNAGFNLYRAESGAGEYIKINDVLIPAKGSATQGSTYEFVDKDVKNRKTYWYKLEDIDLNGTSTMHGPISATPKLQRLALSFIDWLL